MHSNKYAPKKNDEYWKIGWIYNDKYVHRMMNFPKNFLL